MKVAEEHEKGWNLAVDGGSVLRLSRTLRRFLADGQDWIQFQ